MVKLFNAKSTLLISWIIILFLTIPASADFSQELESITESLENSGHFFIKEEDLKKIPPISLTQAEANDDIDKVLGVLEKGFSIGVMTKNPPENIDKKQYHCVTIKYQKAVTQLKKLKKENKEGISTADFGYRVCEILKIIPDNHLKITMNGERIRCQENTHRKKRVGKNIADGVDGSVWRNIDEKVKSHTIPVLGISSMEAEGSPKYDGMLNDAFIEKLQNSKGIILDFRGNSGGYCAPEHLIKLLTKKKLYYPITHRLISDAALALRANELRVFRAQSPKDYDESYAYILGFRLFFFKEMLSVSNNRWAYESKVIPASKSTFNGFIYVLMDNWCRSATEVTIYLLKQIPGVVFVGRPTGGAFHFGGNGGLLLPNSKLYFRISTIFALINPAHINTKRCFIENEGFYPTPGFEVEEGTDALAFTLRHLKETVSQWAN